MPVVTLPKENGDHTAILSHLKLYRCVGVGRWKEVREGRKGKADGRGCLGDGKAGAKYGFGESHFSIRAWQMLKLDQ